MLPLRRIALLAGLIPLAAAGCTMIGHEKVPNWPELKVREHYVAHYIMRDKCTKYVAFGMSPEACAEFDLSAGTCDIWYSSDFPPGQGVIDHERMHCRGYDHIGGGVLTRMLARWQAQQRRASSSVINGVSRASSFTAETN